MLEAQDEIARLEARLAAIEAAVVDEREFDIAANYGYDPNAPVSRIYVLKESVEVGDVAEGIERTIERPLHTDERNAEYMASRDDAKAEQRELKAAQRPKKAAAAARRRERKAAKRAEIVAIEGPEAAEAFDEQEAKRAEKALGFCSGGEIDASGSSGPAARRVRKRLTLGLSLKKDCYRGSRQTPTASITVRRSRAFRPSSTSGRSSVTERAPSRLI